MVKRNLSVNTKFLIYIPTLIYGHELWVVFEKKRWQIQAAEISFLRKVAGLPLRDRVRSLAIGRGSE